MEHVPAGTNPAIGLAERLLRPVEDVAAVLGAIMMLAAMVLTTFDALLRYTIHFPLNFNYFVSENYLLVALVCLPMAWGFRTGGYIRISFLALALPVPARAILLRAGLIASSIYCADLAWMGALNWHDAWRRGLVEMDVVDFPWHLSWIWVPIGLGLLALRLAFSAFGPASFLMMKHDPEEESI